MCGEIDLEKPLISKIQLRHKVREIEYEGIHLVYFSYGRFKQQNDECPSEQETTPSEPEGIRTNDKENGNPSNDQGKVHKRNQDPLTNPKVIDNYGLWMLAPNRVRHHQSSQYHEEDVGERYGKGKSCGT